MSEWCRGRGDDDPFGSHCLHHDCKNGGLVCCWCGEVFIDEPDEHDDHGEFAPDKEETT